MLLLFGDASDAIHEAGMLYNVDELVAADRVTLELLWSMCKHREFQDWKVYWSGKHMGIGCAIEGFKRLVGEYEPDFYGRRWKSQKDKEIQ